MNSLYTKGKQIASIHSHICSFLPTLLILNPNHSHAGSNIVPKGFCHYRLDVPFISFVRIMNIITSLLWALCSCSFNTEFITGFVSKYAIAESMRIYACGLSWFPGETSWWHVPPSIVRTGTLRGLPRMPRGLKGEDSTLSNRIDGFVLWILPHIIS